MIVSWLSTVFQDQKTRQFNTFGRIFCKLSIRSFTYLVEQVFMYFLVSAKPAWDYWRIKEMSLLVLILMTWVDIWIPHSSKNWIYSFATGIIKYACSRQPCPRNRSQIPRSWVLVLPLGNGEVSKCLKQIVLGNLGHCLGRSS